jgi:replication factor A1
MVLELNASTIAIIPPQNINTQTKTIVCMAIKDLTPKQGKVFLDAEVASKGTVREFNKFGKQGKVCDAEIKDETGKMKLTLWNEQVDMINVGDKISIKNGYVGEWQGEMQLSTGKFGSLEVTEKGSGQPAPETGSSAASKPQTKKTEETRSSSDVDDDDDDSDEDDDSLDDVEEEFVE